MHCTTHNEFSLSSHGCNRAQRCNGPVARWFSRRWQKRRQLHRERLATELALSEAQSEQFHALLEQWDATRARRFNHMATLTVPLSTLLAQPSEPRDQLYGQVRSALQAVEADLTGLLDAFADFSDTLDAAQRTRLQSQLDRYRQ